MSSETYSVLGLMQHNNYNAELVADDAKFFRYGPPVVPGKPFVAAYEIESKKEVERINALSF